MEDEVLRVDGEVEGGDGSDAYYEVNERRWFITLQSVWRVQHFGNPLDQSTNAVAGITSP